MQGKTSNTTTSIGIRYGLIAGVVSIITFLVPAMTGANPFKGLWSWITIVLSIVILFLAHKSFKDKGDGFMTYGQGVMIGFWCTLVAMLVGTIFSVFYTKFISDAVLTAFFDDQTAEMEKAGAPDEAIDLALSITKNFFWVFQVIGSFVGGMIIALILTIFTQKKGSEPTF